MNLRPYQTEVIKKILEYKGRQMCVSLPTGAGKTVIFTSLLNHLKGRTLILVNRSELKSQTEQLTDIPVEMVETFFNKMKNKKVDVNDYNNLIVDECHIGNFIKVINKFHGKLIGFTATPNYEKTRTFHKCLTCGTETDKQKCCNKKPKKYKKTIPLSQYYTHLIEGIKIKELIQQGYLVQDDNYILETDTSRLVFDVNKGDYTEESQTLVFGSAKAIKNTADVYERLAKGRKTIIFNPNTLINSKLYNELKGRGHNVRRYDSKLEGVDRIELVDWFKNTKDAILLNVHVFTTGFDCEDIEVVILNKKTKSINLYIQMVGRGGRITDKIFKPTFKVLDLGNNNEDFGGWSSDRDWNKLFYNSETYEVGKPRPASVRSCHSCESIISANSLNCEVCGIERKYGTSGSVCGLPVKDGRVKMPEPNKIIEYCESHNLTTLEARKIVYSYVAEMFWDVPKDKYLRIQDIYPRTKKFITPYYFAIQGSNLEGNRIVKLERFTNEAINSIARRYDTSANL